jgi:tRNA (cytidine/uridine-2'-O-)-methyltransferase
MKLHIVLVEPEIPPNTGNIARLCAATETDLHLVGRLGFRLDDKHLRRAGLDYWPLVTVHRHDHLEELFALADPARFFFFSKKVSQPYTRAAFAWGSYLVFGSETSGLPETLLSRFPNQGFCIPMFGAVRSLNLSTAAGIVLYEALRQLKRF